MFIGAIAMGFVSPASAIIFEGTYSPNVNTDRNAATAKNGDFDTGRLSKGKSAKVKIASAGLVNYFCAVHPSMKGKVSAK